jgi:hypothetical protein
MFKFDVILASEAPSALNDSLRNRNDNWDALAEKLQDLKRGDWLRYSPAELPGKNIEAKRQNVAKAMATRKVYVVIRVLGAHLYVRVRTDQDPKRKVPAAK